MQEDSEDEMLLKEVGEKGLGPVINCVFTGELELGDLSWAAPTIRISSFSNS